MEPFPGGGRILASNSVAALGVVGLTHSWGFDSPKPAFTQILVSYHSPRIDIAPGHQMGLDTVPHPGPLDAKRKVIRALERAAALQV